MTPKHSNIIIVPTSHIAEESIRKIRRVVKKEKPDCIAVELDPARLLAMKVGGSRPPIREFGIGAFLIFSLMKYLQEWLGKKVGILPGKEMLTAVDLAKKEGIQLFLIDRDVRETFMRVKSIGRREKLKLFWLLVKGITIIPFARGKGIDLRKVPGDEIVEEAMGFLKKEMPGIYRVLIQERDVHMAHQLLHLSREYTKIVAVVGAGHKEGMVSHMRQHKI